MRMNDGRIIPKFVQLAKKNKNLTVYDNGKQTRTYCHIWDAVIMIVYVIFSGKKFVYNIGNDKDEISAKNIAIKIKKVFKSKSKIVLKKYPKGYPSAEPRRRSPNIKNIKSEFGYQPKINLSEGLKNIF
jgi:nucleoside-diphosphate-sugar epimerase